MTLLLTLFLLLYYCYYYICSSYISQYNIYEFYDTKFSSKLQDFNWAQSKCHYACGTG